MKGGGVFIALFLFVLLGLFFFFFLVLLGFFFHLLQLAFEKEGQPI